MKPPIIVTGCQRSGTQIAARILAYDFQLKFIPEIHADFFNLEPNTVIHSPLALNGFLETYYANPGVHFIHVNRDPHDIIASMRRIKWLKDDVEDWNRFLPHFVSHQQRMWKLLQTELPTHAWSEIQYESLKSHPLFMSQEDRTNFTVLQWEKDSPVGPQYWENNSTGLKEYRNLLSEA